MATDIKWLAWAAGFIEGEGCFSITRYSFSVQASQVNPEPLYKLKSLFGGSVNGPFYHNQKRKAHHSPYYNWSVSANNAAQVYMTLYSFLSDKRRRQGLRGFQKWKNNRGASGSRMTCPSGHLYDETNTVLVHKRGRVKPMRICRLCRNASAQRWKLRMKGVAA